jgi:hypothetical protein
MEKIDMIGKRFGRLTVIEEIDDSKTKRPRWLCRCECGNKRIVRGISLRKGDTKSCGCLKKELAKKLSEAKVTHGSSKTRLYRVWYEMRCRCYKKSSPDYPRYGGRGINVCYKWRKSFIPFREWAIANGYNENLTLDRINNESDYSPDNCRWVTRETQNNNTRRNYYITYNGETLTLSQWSKKCGINKNTLHSRLTKYGWSAERALTEEVVKN